MWQHNKSRKRMTGSSSIKHMHPMHLLQVPSLQRASWICRRLWACCPSQRMVEMAQLLTSNHEDEQSGEICSSAGSLSSNLHEPD
ncbi:hypothetical protein L208DRAFT_105309 [Tricholoma matsutake]|nr:hypothetical protein L208DRAFT_105309 [Tricholoma matsutake 945]